MFLTDSQPGYTVLSMFLKFWGESQPQRSYEKGSYKKKTECNWAQELQIVSGFRV